jgi:peptidoglycan/LPS O-acetylase OafA/YrhL
VEDSRHFSQLDGARGMAAMVVLVAHSGQTWTGTRLLHGLGQMGVAFFFILSGFLMAWLYARQPFTRNHLMRYAAHRAARVLPLYYAVVLASFFASCLLVSCFVLVPAMPLWTFTFADPGSLATHLLLITGQQTLWTIPVEVQFYLLFPILWHEAQAKRPFRAIAATAAAGALLALLILLCTDDPRFTPLWMHFFLFGIVVALLLRRHPEWHTRFQGHNALGWVAIVLFLASVPGLREILGLRFLPNFIDPLTVGSTALLFLACLFQAGPLRVLATPIPAWLGRISYGLYLLHFPVLMTLAATLLPRIVALPLFFVVTIGLAALSERLFERPLRRRIAALVR